MKKFLTLLLTVALTATLAITGTIAYLTDTDQDVNTMVMGNVQIEQIEQEWNEDQTQLQTFTPGKALLPYVGALAWENETENGGAYRRFTMENVVDKYISVKNTGTSDAYVRSIIALEMGNYTVEEFWEIFGVSYNALNGSQFKFDGAWEWADDIEVTIDGHKYLVMTAVHKDAVAPGETTIPSLLQVYLDKTATNETVAAINGNGNGTYDILALSQAVQADGFATAADALKEGFGAVDAANVAKWFGDIEIPKYVATADEFKTAIKQGGLVTLTEDIVLDTKLEIGAGKNATIELGGNDIAFATNGDAIYVREKATLTINGNGTLTNAGSTSSSGNVLYVRGNCVLNGVTLENTLSSGTALFVNDGNEGGSAKVVMNGGKVVNSNTSAGRAVKVNDRATFELKDGLIESKATGVSTPAIEGNSSTSTIIISGGTVKSAGTGIYANGAEVVITGGTIDAASNAIQARYATVSGDAIIKAGDAAFYTFGPGSAHTNNTVSGGTIKATTIAKQYPGHDKNLSVIGGTFDADPTAYITSGYKVVNNANGTYTVKTA